MAIEAPKYFVFPTRAIDNSLPVNIVEMGTFNKIDKPDVRNRNKTSYSIIFQRSEVAKDGQTLEWRYKSRECRDQDYEDLKAVVNLPYSTGS